MELNRAWIEENYFILLWIREQGVESKDRFRQFETNCPPCSFDLALLSLFFILLPVSPVHPTSDLQFFQAFQSPYLQAIA